MAVERFCLPAIFIFPSTTFWHALSSILCMFFFNSFVLYYCLIFKFIEAFFETKS